MPSPRVSFVVPCYKLAHLLPECVNSILAQTFSDFEILVMDDCSPDDTPAVAQSFGDPRVHHIRNDPNLGHLRNYNKGIGMARGDYVWLISADDYLRRPTLLQHYVELLDRHPEVGFAFCPGYGVRDGQETRLLGQYGRGDKDRIIPGHALLKDLLGGNFVLCPSGLVRRSCYEKLGMFPLDMPLAGDWYLWCLFALHHDVAYFAEPMLCYREHHALSMTHQLMRDSLDACAREEIFIPWLLRRRVIELGLEKLAEECLDGIARTYARTLASERYLPSSHHQNFEVFERSLAEHAERPEVAAWIRARVYAHVGNEYYWRGEATLARSYYDTALAGAPGLTAVRLKRWLLSLGSAGDSVRKTWLALR